ncbi:hypothetical protein AN993_21340 [Stenotrophomonas maltophilia]|nr:hypothetical protein AN993_21340 [Stenotrophomonas maltophilia]MBA0242699.1 hypothetical protein [Stenotrophomonas maltophilia]MBA0247277.1 hypothetical protein [Stenotrophomonas maltophilia]MBA0306244.1 hypothetical protein [Stenotrophomonas maltophilia]MBA0438857.1 hypothetical protein [Stenotrophomonas maltophilia]
MIDNVLEGFDELSDEIESNRQVTLRSAYTGTSQKPEEAARANQLSDQLGQPFGVVAANLGDYEQDARRQEIDDAGRASPHVGDFLSDPRRMALASDEAPKLATYANSLVTGEARATAEPNILEQVIGGIVSGWQRGKANALSLLPDGPAVMDPATGRLTTDRSAEEAALRADQERRAQAADVTSASTERGFQAFDRANKAGSFSGAVRELAGGGTDTLGAIAVTLGQSIGMGAPGLALTAATGGGSRVVTAASAGTGSGLTEFGASIADAMQDAKVDPTDAYAVGQFLRDPQKMAAARDKAAKRGVAIGVFDALTAGVAGHFINNARRSASSAILRTGAEAGVQLGGGAAGEATAQLLTEERLKWGDIIMEGLAEVPTGAVEVHANYRAARASGQVRWINERLDQVMQSGQSNDRLRAATELAGELKLGERSPEDMKALTAQVAGEDARVYLDADQAQTLFQSAPQVLQDMVGGESALAEQLATGQVVIPMAEWMATVPRLPNRDEILRNARTTADGLSPAELESLDIDAMARELGVPLDAPAPDQAAANARAQVQQSVMAQLVGTERYTPVQAESQAQLWGAMFGRLGEVTGQDPVALYVRYAAGIDAAEAPPEGAEAQPRTLMQRGIDALRSLFGRPQVTTDGRGQQTIEREGSAYVQRGGQWLLADDQGQARDFLTLDQARTEAERTGGEIVQDDPIEGQRQTWSVALPDTAAREVLAGDILFQGGAAPRGQIQIGTGRAMQISLFKGADLSTFLHESGHFFLEVYRELATAEDAAPQLRSDLDALLKWFGVESADQIGVDQHEQFARGFEAYLGEGRAPTPELQSVFSQFKQWILGVYRSLRNLDVELTDEVRGVFDRMLASQEEIEAAQARVGFEPIARDLAEAQALGMTERQFADYQAQVAAAREQAEADLMAQLQEADARARERWWKDELANIRSVVEAEVEATPIVRAYRVLTGRKEAAGEPVPEQLQGLKLDRAVLAATYGDGLLDKMGRVYARKGGTHPEEAATLLGFSSADELVQGLWTVRQTLAGVSAEADARMQARHGDPMTDGTLPQRALDAVHGSRKIQLLERELGVLADLAKEPRPNRRELKAIAQALLAEKTARQIRPNEYLVAERKAARAAAQAAAAGRYADALQAKRQQALNAVLFAEARAVQQEVESKVGYIRRQMTPQARERLGKAGADYLEAMDTIADTYEFRDVSGRAVARRQSLRQWVEARQADDDLTAVSDALLARVEAESVTNYADLPITEFRELHDAVTNIARLAKLKNKLLSNKDQRDWESAQAELAGAIRGAIAEGKPLPLSDADLTAMQKVGATYTGLMDWVLRPETVVEWLDGGETGPWHDFLWNQAEAAQQQRIELRNRVGGMLEQTMKALTPAQRADLNRLVYVPSLGRSLSKNTIVAVALNMGNAGNRDKLMRGGFIGKNAEVVQFTPQNIAEMLGHLTPADAQMVQGIWDAVNSLWPDIVEQQRRLSGVAPEQVEPMPLIFTAADGSTVSLRGGYYPAVYDPRAGAGGVKQARAAEEQIMGGTFSRAMTSKGHTKERTEYTAPMLLDYHRVLSRHLNDVITDVSHRGYVKQALRVLEDQELKNLIQQRLSEGAYHSLYGSVKNSVRGASVSEPGSSMAEKIGDAVLTNTAVAALGFRLPLVFANTVVAPIQAAARVDPKYLATGYAAYYRSPGKMTEMIHSLSPFMEERANSLDSSYQVVLGKLSGKRGIRAAAMKMAMEVHRWTVPLAERAIWLGRYQQAQAQGVSVDEAVRLADKSIRTTQQAGAPKDLSAAERDPRYKWVRMFIGPMIIMNNRLQESGLRGLYLGRVQSPARALGTWLSAGVLSNAVFELLMMRGPDGGDDDEKGWDDWSSWLARKTLLFPFQTIPLLRDVAGGIDAAIEGKPSTGRPNPIVDAGVALAKFGQTAWKEGRDWIADDDEPDAEKLIKTGVRAAGPLTGIPSNQMLTTGEYLYDVGTGQYTPDNPAEAAAYLMYRRPKDEQ